MKNNTNKILAGSLAVVLISKKIINKRKLTIDKKLEDEINNVSRQKEHISNVFKSIIKGIDIYKHLEYHDTFYFDSLNSDLNSEEHSRKLHNLNFAYITKPNKYYKIHLEGYTDKLKGRNDSNENLSQRRINSIKDALIHDYGIDASNIIYTNMSDTNTNTNNHAQNRKVVVTIKYQKLQGPLITTGK